MIALAGRRIDGPVAGVPRFPLESVPLVRRRIHALLADLAATALVSAAACGVDLIALEQAGALGLRRRVVIPFGRERFRAGSVVDRPGPWGGLYDGILDAVEARHDLVVLRTLPDDETAFAAVNEAILDEAQAMARSAGAPLRAVLVWDGQARGSGDVTWGFGDAARRRGLELIQVSTLPA